MEPQPVLDNTPNTSFLFCIIEVKPESPPDYRINRMREYLEHHGETDIDTASARFNMMIAPIGPAPLAADSDHPTLSKAARNQHAIRMACAIQAVEKETPLLTGETVGQDEFTFLAAPYNGYPERTPVLRRVTNYAELLYIFSGVKVNPTGRLVFPKPAAPRSDSTQRNLKAAAPADAVAFIASGIASGMLSAIGGAIANSLIEKIFPPGVPSYFDQVYTEIRRIIGGELEQSIIDQINGAINNIKFHINAEYMPARNIKNLESTKDRDVLYTMLQKYEDAYVSGPGGMLGTLMEEKYAKLGFGVFLIGAGLHLALYQEIANIDPSNQDSTGKFKSPLASSYGLPQTGTVAITAIQYAKFAERIWPQIKEARAAKITFGERVLCAFGDRTGTSCVNYAFYRDALNLGSLYLPGQALIEANRVNKWVLAHGNKDGTNPARDLLMKDYESYKARKLSEFSNSFKNPLEIAAKWRQLAETPIKLP